jgi:hypothetical protein
MKKKSLILATCAALALVLALAGAAIASRGDVEQAQSKPPCKTDKLNATAPYPSSYSYIQNSSGGTSGSFTVQSDVKTGPNCTGPPYTFGNGGSNELNVEIIITDIDPPNPDTSPLTDAQKKSLKDSFSFDPSVFTLSLLAGDSYKPDKEISFTFTNNPDIPVGTYDVNIQAKGPNGTGVGPANTTFTIEVKEPVETKVDRSAPTVSIIEPANGSNLLLNDPLHIRFTAIDPDDDGAGTGIIAVKAYIGSCETWQLDITGISVNPTLPVARNVSVMAEANLTASWIGTFSLTAGADDNASHHGSAVANFSVGVNVAPLPPISVAGRQFNAGSTVPIKWQITGSGGAFLPPFADIKAVIIGPPGEVDRVAGEGANFIRWELDASGNAVQYITNYQIPSTLTGNYTVEIRIKDMCGNYIKQGGFTFYASTKGGKQ